VRGDSQPSHRLRPPVHWHEEPDRRSRHGPAAVRALLLPPVTLNETQPRTPVAAGGRLGRPATGRLDTPPSSVPPSGPTKTGLRAPILGVSGQLAGLDHPSMCGGARAVRQADPGRKRGPRRPLLRGLTTPGSRRPGSLSPSLPTAG